MISRLFGRKKKVVAKKKSTKAAAPASKTRPKAQKTPKPAPKALPINKKILTAEGWKRLMMKSSKK